jgi:methylenetetrahydrofolate reductase (NADPH)
MGNISNIEKELKKKKFVITSEFGPPHGCSIEAIKEKVDLLKGHVTAVNVSDLQGANLSMGGLGASYLLMKEGIEPILQMTCRDKNRLMLQSDALSAYVQGIRNILVLTGDFTTIGDHPEARAVFDIDSVQLLWTLSKLEEGVDLSGKELTYRPSFFKGAAINPESNTEASRELQLIKMEKKIESGAEFFQTMPVFDIENFYRFIDRVREFDDSIPIIAGVQLIKSEKMAKFLNRKIPGINVPLEIIERMSGIKDKVSGSIEIAANIINKIKPFCNGIHIGAQGWEKHIPELIKNIEV